MRFALVCVLAFLGVIFGTRSAAAEEPICRTEYGKTRCGYHCRAEYGQLRCAQTPQGQCASAYGQVICWDPPRGARGWPQARCKSEYGMTACGYNCVSGYGVVRCAQTPQGVCRAETGKVTCWDPQRGGHDRKAPPRGRR